MSSLPIASSVSNPTPLPVSLQSQLQAALQRVLPALMPLPDPRTSGNAPAPPQLTTVSPQLAAALQQLADGAGIILNPLLTRRAGPPPMDLNLNQLLNNTVLQNNLQQLPAELLGKP